MTARELLNEIHRMIEVEGVDPDKDIMFDRYDNDTYLGSQELIKIDWLWDNPVDEDDNTKILCLMLNK
jgi:hypothetical protein